MILSLSDKSEMSKDTHVDINLKPSQIHEKYWHPNYRWKHAMTVPLKSWGNLMKASFLDASSPAK